MKRWLFALGFIAILSPVAMTQVHAQGATHRLTVSQHAAKGVQASYITTTPSGIDALCASSPCTHDFPAGTEVTVTVNSNWTFTWGGACAGSQGKTCRVRMNGDKSVSVERRSYKITYTFNSKFAGILIANPGNVVLSANGHTHSFPQGEAVTLTQWPHRGGGGPDVAAMVKWEGACAGQPVGTCRLVMDGDKHVMAEWRDAQATSGEITLKILSLGKQAGHANENPGVYRVNPPGKIVSDCRPFTGGCIERFAAGTTVIVEQLNSSNMQFDRWGPGCDSQTRSSCTVKMDRDRTVEGYFLYTGP